MTITVDGREVRCREGQTIAAALIGAGVTGWRATRRDGPPRGLFCGIGVCFDCLVSVNGSPAVRACLIAARAGDEVTTAPQGER